MRAGRSEVEKKSRTASFQDATIQGVKIEELDLDVTFRPVPNPDISLGDQKHPVWRILLDVTHERGVHIGLDVNGDAVLGRGSKDKELIDFSAYDAEERGVSRRHAMLRPTDSKLIVVDLESTNGTMVNGRSIGRNTPYSVTNGDILTLGQLEFIVRIVKRPTGHTEALRKQADLGDALAQLGKAITSQLEIDDVLGQALEMAMGLTSAGETAIWLVDEESGELFLEAERGIEEEEIRRMRLQVTDSLAGTVVKTGEAVRARKDSGEQVKIKTDYFVDAVIYVPLKVGGVTIGVLAAAHRKPKSAFDARDERVLNAVADFAAVAIQNARLYKATDEALDKARKELIEINSALAHDLRGPVSSVKGYAEIMKMGDNLTEDQSTYIGSMLSASGRLLMLIDQLLDLSLLDDASKLRREPLNLGDIMKKAISDIEGAALVRDIEVKVSKEGTPYELEGDSTRLYRCVLNLVDNAVKYSPDGSTIRVNLAYGEDDITFVVRDSGRGVPEKDLPRIFDKYYRGDAAYTDKAGIGLGLPMVKSIVEAHGGTITLRNVKKGGAEFTIKLPASLRVEE